MKIAKIISTALLLIITSVTFAQTDNNPQTMLKQLTSATIDQIKAYKHEHAKETKVPFQVIYAIVDRELLPHVAKDVMLQSILARQCTYAADSQQCVPVNLAKIPVEQQEQLKQQFIYLLVNMYASALSDADKYTITFKRMRQQIEAKPGAQISVTSQVQMPESDPISISYQLIYQNNQWLVYDFSINGSISIVESLRAQFAPVIQQQGISGLITTLKKHNQSFTQAQESNR